MYNGLITFLLLTSRDIGIEYRKKFLIQTEKKLYRNANFSHAPSAKQMVVVSVFCQDSRTSLVAQNEAHQLLFLKATKFIVYTYYVSFF